MASAAAQSLALPGVPEGGHVGAKGEGTMSTLTKSILISIGLTVVLNAILWMSGCSVITLKV